MMFLLQLRVEYVTAVKVAENPLALCQFSSTVMRLENELHKKKKKAKKKY